MYFDEPRAAFEPMTPALQGRARPRERGDPPVLDRAGPARRRGGGAPPARCSERMRFRLAPGAEAAGYRIKSYDSVGSTNAEAMALGRAGEPGRLWVVSRDQTAGRGRRGRSWAAAPGNLAASLLLKGSCAAGRRCDARLRRRRRAARRARGRRTRPRRSGSNGRTTSSPTAPSSPASCSRPRPPHRIKGSSSSASA